MAVEHRGLERGARRASQARHRRPAGRVGRGGEPERVVGLHVARGGQRHPRLAHRVGGFVSVRGRERPHVLVVRVHDPRRAEVLPVSERHLPGSLGGEEGSVRRARLALSRVAEELDALRVWRRARSDVDRGPVRVPRRFVFHRLHRVLPQVRVDDGFEVEGSVFQNALDALELGEPNVVGHVARAHVRYVHQTELLKSRDGRFLDERALAHRLGRELKPGERGGTSPRALQPVGVPLGTGPGLVEDGLGQVLALEAL
mmetsp:Transcript_6875/g.30220  ORF Transcript_6875/g.30220 Transcript_6875/m.30220 type:complete len:258 (+) Transcript_6875:2970-3743(+)